jgi:hypothetical protein
MLTTSAFRCIISADLMRRAYTCVSTELTRYYLNGAHVEPAPEGGALIVATNGHSLIAIRDPKGLCEGNGIVKLSASTLKACQTPRGPDGFLATPPVGSVLKLIVSGDKASLAFLSKDIDDPDAAYALAEAPNSAAIAHQWTASLIDGTFPDWRRVVGDPDFTSPVGSLDAVLVQRVAGALSDEKKVAGFRIAGTTKDRDNGPHFIFGSAGDIEGFGVVMVRVARKVEKLPPWVKAPPTAIAAE